jgi:hypothetical protein
MRSNGKNKKFIPDCHGVEILAKGSSLNGRKPATAMP